MKLLDLVENIDDDNIDMSIFMKNELNIDSDIALLEDQDAMTTVIEGATYYYLNEVYIIDDFISGYLENVNADADDTELCKAVFDFSVKNV